MASASFMERDGERTKVVFAEKLRHEAGCRHGVSRCIEVVWVGDPQSTGFAWPGNMQSRTLNSCLRLAETINPP